MHEDDDFDAPPSASREVARGAALTLAGTGAVTAVAAAACALLGVVSPLLLALFGMAVLPWFLLLGLLQWVWVLPIALGVGLRRGWPRALGVVLGGVVVTALHGLALVAIFSR